MHRVGISNLADPASPSRSADPSRIPAPSPARAAIAIFCHTPSEQARRRNFGRASSDFWTALLARLHEQLRRVGNADIHLFWRGPVPAWVTAAAAESIQSACVASASVTWHRQLGPTFASRLRHAFESLGRLGYQRSIVVAADVPGLRSRHVREALSRLDDHDVVIGRDSRGGCYLVGQHAGVDPVWVERITWQQNTDAAQILTLGQATRLREAGSGGLAWRLMPASSSAQQLTTVALDAVLDDLDRRSDLSCAIHRVGNMSVRSLLALLLNRAADAMRRPRPPQRPQHPPAELLHCLPAIWAVPPPTR